MSEVAQRCSFAIGDIIDHTYSINKVLGEGSFGKVYAVTDQRGKKYALKLLKLWEVHPDIRQPLVNRFDMEFETGRIPSDYLVHSLAHGFVSGNPYIVMEFCPGGDLLNQMDEGRLDLPKVAQHVLLGLRDLHSCGKVHRDLKPENVLMKSDGTYALTDFGISGDRNKRMTERNIMGRPKQIFGTYAYMPPEQLNPTKDATVLPTTDIFSFGVMMYQLITGGELPYGPLADERDLVPYTKRGRKGEWDRQLLRSIQGGEKWVNMIEGCLQPDFTRRLQTVDHVLTTLPATPGNRPKIPDEPARNFQTRIVRGVLLRVMQGDQYGQVFYLDDMLRGDSAILTMGRNDIGVANDIALTERDSCYVSRRHCTLELDYDLGTWVIRDGQWVMNTGSGSWHTSTNGTYVNSQQVNWMGIPFQPGDIISVGDIKLRAEGY